MDLCKPLCYVLLLLTLDVWLCLASDGKNCSGQFNLGLNISTSSKFLVSDVTNKAPTRGKIQRGLDKEFGFIEHSQRAILPYSKLPLTADNNTWRITCNEGSGISIYVIVMSLQLAYKDYLQIKLKKVNGTVDDHFLAIHTSKKSLLVSLVNENRNVFASQSSFLLGYICVARDKLQTAKQFFEGSNSQEVLQYMHCRPKSFKMLAKQLSSSKAREDFEEGADVGNLFDLKNTGCLVRKTPQCTTTPKVPEEEEESSADGSSD